MGDRTQTLEGLHVFRNAYRRSFAWELWQGMHRAPADLLPFDVVASTLHLYARRPLGVRQVPLDAIVGSVDRPGDFTRNYLPRKEYLASRWASVYSYGLDLGFPPVSLFKLSDIYFVNDGNHRVSVLRTLRSRSVEADVTEFDCRVPLGRALRLSDLPCKAAYAEFLEQTNLDRERPEQSIELSHPASYRKLDEHIAGHAYWIEYANGHPVSVFRAATSWYDLVYSPTLELIRSRRLARDFSGLREADLYIGLTEYHRQLVRGIGRPVSLDIALEHYRMTAARPRLKRLWYLLTRRQRYGFFEPPPAAQAQPMHTGRLYDALPTRKGKAAGSEASCQGHSDEQISDGEEPRSCSQPPPE